jgi:hypothetical protein
MRLALDQSAAVKSQMALQRALDRSSAGKSAPPKRRGKPALQKKGIAINDDGGLEREADVMGRRAAVSKVSSAQPQQLLADGHRPSGATIQMNGKPPKGFGGSEERFKKGSVYKNDLWMHHSSSTTSSGGADAAPQADRKQNLPNAPRQRPGPPPGPPPGADVKHQQHSNAGSAGIVLSAGLKPTVIGTSASLTSGGSALHPESEVKQQPVRRVQKPAHIADSDIKEQDNKHQGSQSVQAGSVSHDRPPVRQLPTDVKKIEADPPIKSQARQGNNINDAALNIADEKHGGSTSSLTATNSATGQTHTAGSAGASSLVATIGQKGLKPFIKKKNPPDLPATAKPASEAEYKKCVAKGQALMKQLEEAPAVQSLGAAAGSGDKGPSKEEFAAQYDTQVIPSIDKTYKDVRSDRKDSDYWKQYHNRVTTDGKEIHAETNRKDADIVKGGKEAFSNSDILFHHYRKVAPESKALQSVRRANVANPETRGVMLYIREREGVPEDKDRLLEFKQGSDHFSALLGTPNGSAVVHMLRDHATSLGRKTIDNVAIMGASLVINLKEFKS